MCLLELTGEDLIGTRVKAPLAKYEHVYVLPMLTISINKGTGIVTSVPSDDPEAYAAIMDLRNRAALREKHGVTDEMLIPYEVVPIVDVPEYGDTSAVKLSNELKIASQNDKEKLLRAKDQINYKAYREGVMKVGRHSGMYSSLSLSLYTISPSMINAWIVMYGRLVKEAKPLIRQELIDSGHAITYSEPAAEVISRSGDVCVCARKDQWFISYGEREWRTQAEALLRDVDTYSTESRRNLEGSLAWLHEWPCARIDGLGSRVPWDPRYLIDAFSDYTIYMAYATAAHLLHAGSLDGSTPGIVPPNQLTNQVWDFIFARSDSLPDSDIPVEALKRLRREFEYWYDPITIIRGFDEDRLEGEAGTLSTFTYRGRSSFPITWPSSSTTTLLFGRRRNARRASV